MSNIGCLLWIFNSFMGNAVKYGKIKNDGSKETTAYFGIKAIVTCVLSVGFFLLILWGILALNANMNESGLSELVMYPILIILGLLELVLFLQFVLNGLMSVVYQFRCNSSVISWISLAVLILTAVGLGLGIYFILTQTNLSAVLDAYNK